MGEDYFYRSTASFKKKIRNPNYRKTGIDEAFIFAMLSIFMRKHNEKNNQNIRLFLYVYSKLKKTFIVLEVAKVDKLFNVIDLYYVDEEDITDESHVGFIKVKLDETINIDNKVAQLSKKNKFEKRKKIDLLLDNSDISYNFIHTAHIGSTRAINKKARLTYPTPIIREILLYFFKNYASEIKPYINGKESERKVVISFQDRLKSRNIGILVAIYFGIPNEVTFILISAVDIENESAYKRTFIFRNEARISMNDFDLDKVFLKYEKKQAELKIKKQKQLTENLASCKIWKGSSLDECIVNMKNIKIKKSPPGTSRKIIRVKKDNN